MTRTFNASALLRTGIAALVLAVPLAGSEAAAGKAAETASASASAKAPVALAAAGSASGGNAAKGKILFLQCAACHAVSPGAPAKVGPNLAGVVGAAPGSRPGYASSPAMKGTAARRWTEQRLDQFIANPRATVPGNKMTFGGVSDPAKRRDLIAYLKSISG